MCDERQQILVQNLELSRTCAAKKSLVHVPRFVDTKKGAFRTTPKGNEAFPACLHFLGHSMCMVWSSSVWLGFRGFHSGQQVTCFSRGCVPDSHRWWRHGRSTSTCVLKSGLLRQQFLDAETIAYRSRSSMLRKCMDRATTENPKAGHARPFRMTTLRSKHWAMSTKSLFRSVRGLCWSSGLAWAGSGMIFGAKIQQDCGTNFRAVMRPTFCDQAWQMLGKQSIWAVPSRKSWTLCVPVFGDGTLPPVGRAGESQTNVFGDFLINGLLTFLAFLGATDRGGCHAAASPPCGPHM